MTRARRTVGILIFGDVEVLDFCVPFEVFSVARPVGMHDDEARLFEVVTIAETQDTVTARHGLRVEPDYPLHDHPPLDVSVVPGGRGTRRERHNRALLEWLARQDERTELTTSVCTGAFLLAECGLLDGKRATTHWGSVGFMRETYLEVEMLEGVRCVDEGRILTSAGISAGTARRTEYDGVPEGKTSRGVA